MSKYITKNCLQCQQEFSASIHELNRGNAKFCGRSCASKFNKQKLSPKEPNYNCITCGIKFYVSPKRRYGSKSGFFFCSRGCKDKAQTIEFGLHEIMPDHYGSGKSSYREIAFRYHPGICMRCDWAQIPQVLQVHHMDRNRENNKIENLQVLCPTCHEVEHFEAKDGRYSGTKKKKHVEPVGIEPTT